MTDQSLGAEETESQIVVPAQTFVPARSWRPVKRALLLFWGPTVAVSGVGVIVLQLIGAPKPDAVALKPAVVVAEQHASPAAHTAATPTHGAPAHEEAAVPSQVRPDADPALLEATPDFPDRPLPRIGPGQRTPMQAYAAAFDVKDPRPRVAILVAGAAMSAQDTEDAIRALPAAVSFAFSPYAANPSRQLAAARVAGHEALLSIPMEPSNYPLNDAGNRALLTGASPADNALNLRWALSRMTAYAGATGALGQLRGERYSTSASQMSELLAELARRGVFYIDARPGIAPATPTSRSIDVLIDDPATRSEIDGRLARLETIARQRGSAIGLVSAPSPVVTDRINAWVAALPQKGIALAPVSATLLANMPKVVR